MEQVPGFIAEIANGIASAISNFWPDFLPGTVSEGCRRKTQNKYQHSAQGDSAAATCNAWVAGNRRVPAGNGEEHSPEEPSGPLVFPKWYEREDGGKGDPSMQAGRKGVQDVATIELSTG